MKTKKLRYQIYDAGDTVIDRYTLRIPAGNHENTYYGFNGEPFHPQGFGQYCGEYPQARSYKHLGKIIKLVDLPEQAQQYVKQILKDY